MKDRWMLNSIGPSLLMQGVGPTLGTLVVIGFYLL